MENNQEYQCACECCASAEQMSALRTEQLIKLISSIVLLIVGWVLSEFTKVPDFVYLLCFAVSYILVGFSVVRDAILGIMSGRVFNENLLMSIASLGAFVLKEYHEGCAVMVLYTIGEMLQYRAIESSRRNLASVMNNTDHTPIQSSSEKFITKFARVYTPIVCGIALLIVVVPPLLLNGVWGEWIHRGLSALVVSCPCAIVVSVPLCFFGGIGSCSKQGIYVSDSSCIEKLKDYDNDVTQEQAVADGIAFSDFSEETVAAGRRIAKKTRRLATENIVISLAVKVVILVLSVFLSREIPMWLAAFGDVGICVIAILNSLRALK